MSNRMRLQFKMILRYLRSQNRTIKMTVWLSSLGVILGVCCLVLTMAVVSGVQKLIQDSITDLTGDMLIVYRGKNFDPQELKQNLKNLSKDFVTLTPFVSAQGVVVNKGEILGVVLHGLHLEDANKVLHIRSHVISGHYNLESDDELPNVVVGKEIAKRLKLKIGDTFQIVIPRPSIEKIQSFSPVVQKMRLSGIADFGKYDYNEKIILTQDKVVQKLLNLGAQYIGAYVKFKNTETVPQFSQQIADGLGMDYRVRDWKEINHNFFSAVALEKIVIFIVVLFIVIVASFNVSSTIFVNVLRRFSDISILKTLGATKSFLIRLFIFQGLLLGVVSSAIGILLGLFLAMILKYTELIHVPGDIYRFDHLPVEIRLPDLVAIFIVTVMICFLSSILPARRGANLKPVEGLKYE